MQREVNVLALIKGDERFIYIYDDASQPPLIEAFRERFMWPKRKQAYKTLQRGFDRGEIPAGTDLDLLLDTLYGPIYMRFLIRHFELREEFADQICELVLKSSERRTR